MFIRNRWYVAGWADEVGSEPLRRILLGEPVVIFRKSDRSLAMLRDRCPHRAVALSRGKVIGDNIQCPYHGLEFDGGGVCVLNPHIKGSPQAMRVHAFPVKIMHGAIWFWPGDVGAEATVPVPDFSILDRSDKFSVVRGYVHVNGNYKLVIDNLLDLSHAEYVHPNTVGTIGSSSTAKSNIANGEDWVTVERKIFDLKPSAVFSPVWNKSERIDQESNMTWRSPSNLFLDLSVTVPGGSREEGLRFPSAHLLTPETDRSTHYFWASARNFELNSEEMNARVTRLVDQAFSKEDRPMIESAQENIDLEGPDYHLANFTVGDGGAMRARRIIEKMIVAEGDAGPN